MNKPLILVLFLLILLLLSCQAYPCYADYTEPDDWDLVTEDLSSEEENIYLSRIRLMVCHEMYPCGLVRCYAVAKDGCVAIGINEGEIKVVHVIDAHGEYLYSIKFAPKSSYSLGWRQSDHTLLIYIFRSDRIVCIKSDQNICVQGLANTPDNYHKVHELFSSEQIVGNSIYNGENSLGLFNFLLLPDCSMLVATEGNETRVIYEAEKSIINDRMNNSIGILLVWFFAAFLLYRIFKKIRKRA